MLPNVKLIADSTKSRRTKKSTCIDCKTAFGSLETNKKKEECFSCLFCDKQFSIIEDLRNHLKSHRSYSCDRCDACYVNVDNFVRHYKTHDPQERTMYNFTCWFCQKTCSREVPPMAVSCLSLFCDAKFANLDDALRHEHTDNDNKCFLCRRPFRSGSNLTMHVKRKHKNYPCQLCGVQFKQKVTLNEHTKHHITCTLCKAKGK